MKKEKVINIFIIILVVIIFFSVFSYWSSKKYEKQKIFFVSSCIDTLHSDHSYNLDDLIDDFIRKIPQNMQDYIGKEFGEYTSYIENKKIEQLCGNIFDFYQEARE